MLLAGYSTGWPTATDGRSGSMARCRPCVRRRCYAPMLPFGESGCVGGARATGALLTTARINVRAAEPASTASTRRGSLTETVLPDDLTDET